MMKKFLTIITLASLATASVAQGPHKLTVVIDNVGSTNGRVMVGIYNKEKGAFEQQSRYDGQAKIATKGRMTFVFELPQGAYAVGAYHDENNNGELDKNWLGIPKEPYIMSGNRKMPDFNQSLIKLSGNQTIVLKL